MLFYAGRNPPPTRLIFFRDGVSEGEYEQVAQQEIQAITGSSFLLHLCFCWCTDAFDLGAIDKLWMNMKVSAPKPKLTFIVVGKRWALPSFLGYI
jgi:eukaryotic translation initiation factor 2C